jgi:type I restriction enzyme S subunit
MAASKPSAEQLITQNIDVWTSAIKKRGSQGRGSNKKITLYGIKKLRELILELAVRGLLVPQDPSDEPASVLLKKIAAEKEQLIKDKKIKKQKLLPPIDDDEKPFELPDGWLWSRLGVVCKKVTDGSHNPPRDAGEGYPMLSSQNVNYDVIDFDSPSRFVTIEDFERENLRTAIKPLDVLLNIVASIGRSAVVPIDAPEFVLQRSVAVLSSKVDSYYLARMLVSPLCLNYYNIHAKGTAQKGIYLGKLSMMPLAIPPEAEQSRVFDKINELMALCDQLEQQTESSLTAHQTLVETLLNTLLTAAQTTVTKESNSQSNSNQESSFDQAWNRIAQHFDVLFTTEHSIDQLKQTILQLAVMGKLVSQDPNDEPASVLLEKIAAEKEQLIKDKKIKRQKSLPPIGDDEKPFELPVGWEWVRFFDVNTVKAELVPAINFPDENQIAPDSIGKGTGLLIEDRTVGESGVKGPNNKFYTGQILYSKIRPSLNKVVIAPYDGLCSADMYPIICHSNKLFMLKYMLSELFLVQVRKAENRVKMPKLNLESLGLFLTVLPPEAEQPRIANRINEFMELCEVLKANIRDSQVTQLHLADAMAEQALV